MTTAQHMLARTLQFVGILLLLATPVLFVTQVVGAQPPPNPNACLAQFNPNPPLPPITRAMSTAKMRQPQGMLARARVAGMSLFTLPAPSVVVLNKRIQICVDAQRDDHTFFAPATGICWASESAANCR